MGSIPVGATKLLIMTKKGKGSYRTETEGNNRSGGWVQPRRPPQRIYKSNFMKNLKFFAWSLGVQVAVIVLLTLILGFKGQLSAVLFFSSVLISAFLVILKK